MAIRNRWVTVHYRLFDSQGEAVESGEREITYLHGGYGEIFQPIEQALEGKAAGFETSLYLEPEQTFGDYDADLIRLAARADFPEQIEPGMSFDGVPGEAPDGRIWIVTDISDDAVVLDGNHPLAGMALRFDLRIVEVSEADDDEIADQQALAN
ncbi:MAG TPA: peptidylprolyl isomerase [Burkholderiaceae bacterium]|nr:peptidylprolyl isomerase [Burkholderiaceae bacterium]